MLLGSTVQFHHLLGVGGLLPLTFYYWSTLPVNYTLRTTPWYITYDNLNPVMSTPIPAKESVGSKLHTVGAPIQDLHCNHSTSNHSDVRAHGVLFVTIYEWLHSWVWSSRWQAEVHMSVLSEQVKESVQDRVSEWVKECEWVGGWVRVWVSEWDADMSACYKIGNVVEWLNADVIRVGASVG